MLLLIERFRLLCGGGRGRNHCWCGGCNGRVDYASSVFFLPLLLQLIEPRLYGKSEALIRLAVLGADWLVFANGAFCGEGGYAWAELASAEYRG
jgi:hypothetical protein